MVKALQMINRTLPECPSPGQIVYVSVTNKRHFLGDQIREVTYERFGTNGCD